MSKKYERQIDDKDESFGNNEGGERKIDFEDFDLNSSTGEMATAPSNAVRNTGYIPPAAYVSSPTPPQRQATSPATPQPYVPPTAQTLYSPPTVPTETEPEQLFGQGPTAVGVDQLIPPKPKPPVRIWNIEYYQFLFDVDTRDVAIRILRSLSPLPAGFFDTVGDKPDLWGPLWISSTLIFTLAVLGNVTTWIKFHFNNQDPDNQWNYDATKLGIGAGVIYGYLGLIPLLLWGACKWFKIELGYLQAVCLYGYSLFIFIPITAVNVISYTWLHWVSIAIATLISACFIVFNLVGIFRPHMGTGAILLLVAFILHAGLGIFQVYFFVAGSVTIKTS
ncbi:hypothetical protein PROFUN_10100 [Planoprotostelium fungivorum]|uniref:Protein YIPF n=1 Tax=Planoprotostelium fungivorum TaxID=1890364 RepID=A0A2P6NEY9_9EUKA|nr:hypothetical protein PROFUN_10100 [Planoprotostelium fungivorum]